MLDRPPVTLRNALLRRRGLVLLVVAAFVLLGGVLSLRTMATASLDRVDSTTLAFNGFDVKRRFRADRNSSCSSISSTAGARGTAFASANFLRTPDAGCTCYNYPLMPVKRNGQVVLRAGLPSRARARSIPCEPRTALPASGRRSAAWRTCC